MDAVRARIRESRFYIRKAEAVVNFLVTFVKKALLGPEMHFGIIFRILSPKIDFGAQNALLRPKSLLGPKGLHFHQNSIGFISIRGMGTQKCNLSQKVHFGARNELLRSKCVSEPKSDFGSKNQLFGLRPAPDAIWAGGM